MRNRVLFPCLAVLMLGFVLPRWGVAASPWQGQWISAANSNQPNTWLCFRKTFDLAGPARQATARIACDSKYWLWINGRLAVFEGQLKRGPTPKDTYYDVVDLAPYLSQGRNTVAVLVWYWGKNGFSHNSSGQSGLVFDATIDGRPLVSDATWLARIDPAYGTTEPPHPNFRLPESNIRFDAREDLGPWTRPGFDDADWPAAVELGRPPVSPWNALYRRPIPLWKDGGLVDYAETVALPHESDGEEIVARLPYNAHVTPYFKIDAPAGLRIDIQTDDYLGGGPPNVRSVYITRDGVQEYESLGWMNGHDVRYKMPAGVKVLAMKYRETGYDADFEGKFVCDDEALNTLWRKAARTLYVTMRDTYMDCPDRERSQWWGDATNELGEAFYVLDAKRGPLLARKGILELARWQRDDKTLYSPVPAGIPAQRPQFGKPQPQDGTWSRELPRQMLASVGWYGFWTYYRYTGDAETIREVYPAVRDYLSLWKLGEDGLVVHRTGEWDWTDWGQNKDVPVLENAWVYLALKAGVAMARLTGNEGDVPDYEAKMRSIAAHFNEKFWQGDKYRSPGYKDETDDRAQAMAVVAGLAPAEYYPAIRDVLRRQYYASPYMEKYVLESLFLMDAPDEAITRMKTRWAAQIESPLTTLWEGWGIGKEGYGGGTYNHAWSGGALTALSEYAAGVAPTSPGFASFHVMPQAGSLERIEAVVPSARGDIGVRISREDGRFALELTAPKKTMATVGIPKQGGTVRQVRCNGKVVWSDGKPQTAEGVAAAGADDRWLKFSVPAGTWRFEADY